MIKVLHLVIGGAVGFFLISGYFMPPSFAQRASLNVVLRTFHGAVKEIDSEKSSLLLETDEGDIEFLVPSQARIFRGPDSVLFSDIQKEDEATIKYYEDEKGRRLVLSIVLEG